MNENGRDQSKWVVTAPVFAAALGAVASALFGLIQWQHVMAERRDAVQLESLEARCDRQDGRMSRIEISQRLAFLLLYGHSEPEARQLLERAEIQAQAGDENAVRTADP